MPRISKLKLKARKANQASVNARKAAKRDEQIQIINKELLQMNDNELQLIYQDLVQSADDKKVTKITHRQKLIDTIEQLPDDQLKSAIHLLNKMKYSKGPHE
ncbi:29146_t:CDS:1, partial [Racocetra persica]